MDTAPNMTEASLQSDPFNSPHPVPWNWVLATHTELSANGSSGVSYYRTPSLISPDGQYAAYSRIEMQVEPELYHSRVSSVMFIENLTTGELRAIHTSSGVGQHPLTTSEDGDLPGAIAMLIPVSWSASGDRLLGRQLEGVFSTSDVSDSAVIWERDTNKTTTLTADAGEHSMATLLGWSETNPNQVLFRAGELGEETWPLWAVNSEGKTFIATGDKPIVFGQAVNHLWAGPQRFW